VFATAEDERRTGPLDRFEKRVLIGFAVAAVAQAALGGWRASIDKDGYGTPLVAALGLLVCAVLWLLRYRHQRGSGAAQVAGLLLGTAGLYGAYSATNAPFASFLERFSVPLLLVLVGALLLFAEQEPRFHAVVLVLVGLAFVLVQVVLTREALGAGGVRRTERTIETQMEPRETARAFVNAINAHDPAAIVALATADHRFIDSLGNTIAPAVLRGAWEGYFRMVPDYRIEVREWVTDGDLVVALGTAAGTFTKDGTLHAENAWHTPAAWRAVIRAGKVAEWQVYADNEPIRAVMRK
jgi:ketosteroid isomerase-like protein